MQKQTEQPTFVSKIFQTISGQLAEWGIEFSQDRVAQLSAEQQDQLQTWINTGVDADETYQKQFASLPEFMENELLEMKGEISTRPREAIIEQAINAYETETPITGNPYLFDTADWHLWRQAYCHWHHGETLNFDDESTSSAPENRNDETITDINQRLTQLFPLLIQSEHSLKKLRRELKKTKQQKNSLIQQQSELIRQLSESLEVSTSEISSTNSEDVAQQTVTGTRRANLTSDRKRSTKIIRIPVTGPESNRVEVSLQENSDGQWQAGHLWSVETDLPTKQRSRGSRQPDRNESVFPTEAQALINEVLYLSQGVIGVIKIEGQIIDYLNMLEEYPGQFDVCSTCHCHFIVNEFTQSGLCDQCSADSDT